MSGKAFARILQTQLRGMEDRAVLGVIASAVAVAAERSLFPAQDVEKVRAFVAVVGDAVKAAKPPAPTPDDDAQLDLETEQ